MVTQTSPSALSATTLIFPGGLTPKPPPSRPKPPTPTKLPTASRVRDFIAKLCPGHAVAYCGRRARHGVSHVEITERGEYRGVYACNSSLFCPCCGPRLAEERAEQIAEANDNWAAMGGTVSLLTLTVRHGRRAKLRPLLDGLQRAWDSFRRHLQSVLRPFGLAHHVRALEITQSAVGGWHPHVHVVLYHRAAIAPAIVATLQQSWASCSVAVGLLRPSLRRGLDVQHGAGAAGRYAAKSVWSSTRPSAGSGAAQAARITNVASVAKAPGADHATRTIRDLLDETVMHHRREDARLVREYANAVGGRSALRWSHGARAALVYGPRAAAAIGRAIASIGRPPTSTWVPPKTRILATIAARPVKPLMTFDPVTGWITILPDHECMTDFDLVVAAGMSDRLAARAVAIERLAIKWQWSGAGVLAQQLVDRYVARLRRAYEDGTLVPRAITRWDVDRARARFRCR